MNGSVSVRERLPHERSETKAKRKRNSRKTDLRKLFVGRKDVIFESAVVVVKLGVAINGTKGHQQPTWFPTLNCSLQLFSPSAVCASDLCCLRFVLFVHAIWGNRFCQNKVFKACGNNYFAQIANIYSQSL